MVDLPDPQRQRSSLGAWPGAGFVDALPMWPRPQGAAAEQRSSPDRLPDPGLRVDRSRAAARAGAVSLRRLTRAWRCQEGTPPRERARGRVLLFVTTSVHAGAAIAHRAVAAPRAAILLAQGGAHIEADMALRERG
jgi:hypothetical protein